MIRRTLLNLCHHLSTHNAPAAPYAGPHTGPELWYRQGLAAAEADHGKDDQTRCPYGSGTVSQQWWARGYDHTVDALTLATADEIAQGATERARALSITNGEHVRVLGRLHAVLDRERIPNAGIVERVEALAAGPAHRSKRPTHPARVVAILSAVGELQKVAAPTAPEIAAHVLRTEATSRPFAGLEVDTVARIVSDIAAEGRLTSDGKKPMRYTCPALAVAS